MRIPIILLIFLCSPAFSIPPNENEYFPHDVFYHSDALTEYIGALDLSNQNVLRKEYLNVLDFLEKSVDIHKKNIENILAGGISIKRPAIIDGILSFVVLKVPVSKMWNIDSQKYVLLPDYSVCHDEIVSFATSINIYNILIDFWYNKTGELLNDKINYDKEIKCIPEKIFFN